VDELAPTVGGGRAADLLAENRIVDGVYLAVRYREDVPGAKDDAPDSTALALMAAKSGQIGSTLFA
jgi:hypothetical protein